MARSRVKQLKNLLANSFGDDLDILEENYEMLTAPGEHYGSIMLAVSVSIRKPSEEKAKTLNLVAKLIPASEMLRVVFNIGVTFKKEVNAYLNIIPALIQLQEEYNVPSSMILDMFPKCYGARLSLDETKNEVEENAAIIFENLKVQGYVMEDRLVGFDFQHAKMIVKDLARFHSVSVALRKLKPELFKKKVGSDIVKGAVVPRLPQSFRDCVIQNSATIEELKPYVSKLKEFLERTHEEIQHPPAPPSDSFAAIIHTDYWVNNTMVLRDKNGSPVKNKMVDLQLLNFGSGVCDLIFFLFTSVNNEVLDEHYDELIRFYHEAFIDSIKYFNMDLEQFSWSAYMDEIDDIGPKEAYHIIVMIKPIFTERNKITNSLEDFQPSDWNREDLLGEAYKIKLKDTVLALARRHWL